MQIGTTAGPTPLSGAQVALRLLGQAARDPSAPGNKRPEAEATPGDVKALLTYLKAAKAAVETAPAYDPADDLPEGWSMGALVPVESLTPELREIAAGFGATHVRLYGADPVDDDTLQRKVGAFLDGADGTDDSYASDPAYLAAKAEGKVSIRRLSDVLADLGDRRGTLSQSMALFRGPNGSDYFGSGGGGTPSAALQDWQTAQEAAGQVVVIGGTMGQEFVASWDAL